VYLPQFVIGMLQPDRIDRAVVVIDQLAPRFWDFRRMLLAQGTTFELCAALAGVLNLESFRDAGADRGGLNPFTGFEKIWFFLVLILYSVLGEGSPELTAQCVTFVEALEIVAPEPHIPCPQLAMSHFVRRLRRERGSPEIDLAVDPCADREFIGNDVYETEFKSRQNDTQARQLGPMLARALGLDSSPSPDPMELSLIGKCRHPLTRIVEYFAHLDSCARSDELALVPALSSRKLSHLFDSVALLWVINTPCELEWESSRFSAFLQGDQGDHKLLNHLFYHASIRVHHPSMDVGTAGWKALLRKPNFHLFTRFTPESMAEITECLRNDLDLVSHIAPSQVRTSRRVGISWKAWLRIFTPNVFVVTLLRMLMDNHHLLSNTLSAKSLFLAAACLLLWATDRNDELVSEVISIALTVVEQDYPGSEFAGEGLAGFCLILSMGLLDKWTTVFQDLLAFRQRLASQNPPSGTTQRAFCVSMITNSLYVGHLHKQIGPEVFATPLMRKEWQAAIDYFIARATPDLWDEPVPHPEVSVDGIASQARRESIWRFT
jgi:hypothetical protein